MESFEVLGVNRMTHHEVSGRAFLVPVLYVDVFYQNKPIVFKFFLNSESKWTFIEFRLLDDELSNRKKIHNVFYNFLKKIKAKDFTFRTFNQKMNALGPTLLNHPKVRLKVAFYLR